MAGASDKAVGVDQHPGQQRPAHGGQPEDRAERAERLADLLAREHRPQDAEPLGDQQRPERPLHQPGHDDRGRIPRQAAGQRRGGEARDTDQEDTAPAVPVAEPAAGDQQNAQRQRVAGPEPLDPDLPWQKPRRRRPVKEPLTRERIVTAAIAILRARGQPRRAARADGRPDRRRDRGPRAGSGPLAGSAPDLRPARPAGLVPARGHHPGLARLHPDRPEPPARDRGPARHRSTSTRTSTRARCTRPRSSRASRWRST
jgi:hypothetical protein